MALNIVAKKPASNRVITDGGFFEEVTQTEMKTQFVCAIFGTEKTGKTNWSLSAPGPIALFDMDIGLEGVMQKFTRRGKKIYRCVVDTPNRMEIKDSKVLSQLATKQVARFEEAYQHALASKEIRTIVIDNGSVLWELLLLAHFGKTVQIPAHLRTMPNLQMSEIVRRPLADDACTKNVIWVHQAKKQYAGDNWDGKSWEMAAYNKMGGLVQAVLRTSRDKKERFHLTVSDCRHDPAMNGKDFVLFDPKGEEEPDNGPFSAFAWVASQITDTEPTLWED